MTCLQNGENHFSSLHWIEGPGDDLGSEFMPDLFEDDFVYMPTTLLSISIGKPREQWRESITLEKLKTELELKSPCHKLLKSMLLSPPPCLKVKTDI